MKTRWYLTTAVLILCGCSTLNPYDAQSDCPDPYNGACVSTPTAYKRSKVDPQNETIGPADPKHDSPLIKERAGAAVENKDTTTEDTYKRALFEEIAGLAQSPITPVRVPAKQMRVLVLGYEMNDRFYGHRYVFFQGDKPHWILNIIEE